MTLSCTRRRSRDRNATYQQELEAAEQAQDEGGEEFVPADGLGQLYDANPYDPDGILPTSNQIKALSFAEREALERAHPGIIEQVIQASQWRWRNEEDGGRTNARATAEAERMEQRPPSFRQDGEAQLDAARKAYLDNFDRMTHWQRALRGAAAGVRAGGLELTVAQIETDADVQIVSDELPAGGYTLEELPARPGASRFALTTGPGGVDGLDERLLLCYGGRAAPAEADRGARRRRRSR